MWYSIWYVITTLPPMHFYASVRRGLVIFTVDHVSRVTLTSCMYNLLVKIWAFCIIPSSDSHKPQHHHTHVSTKLTVSFRYRSSLLMVCTLISQSSHLSIMWPS